MFENKYRYLFIFLLGFYSFINILYVEALDYYKISIPGHYIFLLILLIVLGIWEVNRLADALIQKIYYRLHKRIHYLIIAFVASLFITLLVTTIPTFILGFFILKYTWGMAALPLKLIFSYAFRVNLFLNTINSLIYFIRQYKETQLKAEELKKISLQAQFQTLKNQINPHFLFNNLSALTHLVHKDPELADEFIQQLSKVYRYVLNNNEKELVTLSTEMDFINSYLYILQKRFGENLEVDIKIFKESMEMNIIPVALQMLIENAIKHNVISKNKNLKIDIYTEQNFIIVKNNLQLKKLKECSTNIGLNNIIKRYEYLSASLVEVINTDGFFTVKIPLIKVL